MEKIITHQSNQFMLSEEELLTGLREGDRNVIKYIYTNYFPGISFFIQNNKGSEEDGRDIFQESLLILYQKAKNPLFNLSSSFYTYLFAISKNLWLKRLEKKRKLRVTFLEKEELMIVDELASDINRESQYRLFRKKFGKLSTGCQEVLELFFNGTPMKEIAQKLNFGSVQYAKKRKFQCKEKLISLIRSDELYNELL